MIYWYQQSVDEIPATKEWLHPSEREVLSAYRFDKKKKDWILGRWTAKNAVNFLLKSDFPNLLLSHIEIRRAPDGAPEVFYQEKPVPVIISLSHSHGKGFCIITSGQMNLGCDLEKIEPRSDGFVEDYLTSSEQDLVRSAPKENQPLWSNLIWSAKESVLKATRLGLSVDTREIEVEFETNNKINSWNILRAVLLNDQRIFRGYWRRSSGFIYTLVSDRQEFQLVEIN